LAIPSALPATVLPGLAIPDDGLLAVDSASIVHGVNPLAEISASEHAAVHMEDTTPLDIGTLGSPNAVAAPAQFCSRLRNWLCGYWSTSVLQCAAAVACSSLTDAVGDESTFVGDGRGRRTDKSWSVRNNPDSWRVHRKPQGAAASNPRPRCPRRRTRDRHSGSEIVALRRRVDDLEHIIATIGTLLGTRVAELERLARVIDARRPPNDGGG
jgi:hypothetical protein